mgnify:CR=1 FL=1
MYIMYDEMYIMYDEMYIMYDEMFYTDEKGELYEGDNY